jgi:photosystem II stability/assembly factor-like uncharacterized protein
MFEHLDDPLPPEPTARTLGLVLQRSASLRRRRTVLSTTTVAVLAVSLGVLVGSSVTRSPVPVNADFSSEVGVAAGTPVPLSALEDVVFVNQNHGYALAAHKTQTALVESSDAGETWQVVQGMLPVQYPSQIEFTDSVHGYLWGGAPSSDGALPLWVTSNGGLDWTEAPMGPVVSDVSAVGANVWAVVESCFISVSAPQGSCPVTIQISDDYGSSWSTSAATPPVAASSTLSVSDQGVELARMTPDHAYLLSSQPNGANSNSQQLVYTPDAGRTWVTRTDPCPSSFSIGEQIAGSGTKDLWLICASEASSGTQAKALYRSSDGGLTWVLASAANAPVLSANVVLPAGGGLPVGGYVSPYSLAHENLAVLSSTNAWLFPDRTTVFETTDGGRNWEAVSTLATAGLAGEGTGNVTFVDPTHGWVCETGVGLWRTSDGANWKRLGS